MKFHMRLKCPTFVVLCYAVLSTANQEFDRKVTKVWSLSRGSDKDDTAVANVTSSSIVMPSSYSNDPVISRTAKISQDFKPYVFRPRAVPVKKPEQPPEKSVYYTSDNKYKTEILFPGNYFEIPKEKSVDNARGSSYNPLNGGQFEPKAIPLIRDQGFGRRSLNVDLDTAADDSEQSVEETPEEQVSRRSLSYILGGGEDEEADEDDGEYEEEDELEMKKGHSHLNHKLKKKKKQIKKYSKYMMPLLLAYKLKYFALIPVLIGGLVLLVGATGLAGFFFALFAAVMGLQKGGGY